VIATQKEELQVLQALSHILKEKLEPFLWRIFTHLQVKMLRCEQALLPEIASTLRAVTVNSLNFLSAEKQQPLIQQMVKQLLRDLNGPNEVAQFGGALCLAALIKAAQGAALLHLLAELPGKLLNLMQKGKHEKCLLAFIECLHGFIELN